MLLYMGQTYNSMHVPLTAGQGVWAGAGGRLDEDGDPVHLIQHQAEAIQRIQFLVLIIGRIKGYYNRDKIRVITIGTNKGYYNRDK